MVLLTLLLLASILFVAFVSLRIIRDRYDPACVSARREAEIRADALLKEQLGIAFGHFEREGYLVVPSPTRARRAYRIPREHGRVEVLEDGRTIMALCIQPVDPLPAADVVLLHKLMIEGNEAEYLRIANQFNLRGYPVGRDPLPL